MRKNIIVSVILTFIVLFFPQYSYSWTYTTRWDPANMDGWYTWDSYSHTEAGITFSPTQPDGNTKTMRVLLPDGVEAAGFQFGGASRPFPSTEEVWAQFYVLFPNNYIWHPVSDKISGWLKWPGASNNPVLVLSYGKWVFNPQVGWPGYITQFIENQSHTVPYHQKNHWYKVNQHLRMNTPGVMDGLYELWIDDQLVSRHTNVGYREAGNTTGFVGFRHLMVWGGIRSGLFETENTHVYYGTSIVSSQNIFNLGTVPALKGMEPMSPSKISIK